MVGRLLVALAMLVGGLGGGYALWGTRVTILMQTLDRVTLEDDLLRTRLAADYGASGGSVASLLAALSSSVSAQETLLREHGLALDKIADAREGKILQQLRECSAVQEKVQRDLESCLFVKHDLERAVAAQEASQEASKEDRPTRGTSKVTKTIVIPSVPTSILEDDERPADSTQGGKEAEPEAGD